MNLEFEKTHSYTYFGIGSNGDITERGLVGNLEGLFDPDDITKLLGIEPFKKWKKGDLNKSGREYFFHLGMQKNLIKRD